MAAVQPQPLELKVHRLESQNHWIVAVAIVAIVALIGVVAWAAVPRLTTPDGQATAADLVALWSSHDGTTAATVYADGATVTDSEGVVTTGLPAIAEVVRMSDYLDLKAEVAGPVVQDGRTLVVPITLTWFGNTPEETTPSLHRQDVLSILQLDDAGRIVSHRDYGAAAVVVEE